MRYEERKCAVDEGWSDDGVEGAARIHRHDSVRQMLSQRRLDSVYVVTYSGSVKSHSSSLASMRISRGHFFDKARQVRICVVSIAILRLKAGLETRSSGVTQILVQSLGVLRATSRQCFDTLERTRGVLTVAEQKGAAGLAKVSGSAEKRKMQERSSTGSFGNMIWWSESQNGWC